MSGDRRVEFTSPVARELDFIRRLADAWDGRGDEVFYRPREHQALAALCYLPAEVASKQWSQLTGSEREAIVRAARMAIDLGQNAARILSAVPR